MFDFTRRSFLKGMMATAAVSAYGIDLKSLQGKTPKLRFGVVSDVHITTVPSTNYWDKALKWFDGKGADAVMVAGDIADLGQVEQLKNFADAWYKVFPNDTSSSGRKVERFITMGNHDWEGQYYGNPTPEVRKQRLDNCIRNDQKKAWDYCFHEEFQPIIRKEIKGYTFIGAHWPDHKGIEAYMSKAAGTIDPKQPFFYTQHPHPKDTIYGPWAWGHDGGESTRAFSAFSNAVVFTGHSHYPLSDESGIWQGRFTSIGTASLRYIGHRYGRENGGETGGMLAQMGRTPSTGNHGLFVTVYDDCIVLERHDFTFDKTLGPDWILPLPLLQEAPYNFEKRKQQAAQNLPAFAKDAAKQIDIKEVAGKDRDKHDVMQVVVTFPTALAGGRHFDYEVRPEFNWYDVSQVLHSKRVFPKNYFQATDLQEKTAQCVFSYNELAVTPKAGIRFVITALDCFGNRGESITSATVKLTGKPTPAPAPAAPAAPKQN